MDKWLRPSFANLMKNKKFSDCRILVENESFDCHKLILSSASEFFERMFLSDFQESQSSEYRLSDVSPDTFRIFMDYVYTYDCKKLEENTNMMILNLFECGNKWLVESITADCQAILTARAPQMGLGNLIATFQFSHNAENKDLIGVVSCNLYRFGPNMNCDAALFLTSDVFEKYVILSDGYIPEVERFKMIEAYATVNGLIDAETVKHKIEMIDKKGDTDSGVDGTISTENKSLKDDGDEPVTINSISDFENEGPVSLPDKAKPSAEDKKDLKLKKMRIILSINSSLMSERIVYGFFHHGCVKWESGAESDGVHWRW
nr:kelch repeat and BTB domain-containing protein 4-like [Drosophila bipectinata]